MGYTHYWNHDAITPEVWAKIMDDTKKLIVASQVKLVYEYDEPQKHPYVGEDAIHFNGVGDDGHETFVLNPNACGFEFCKTARKPYDLTVCAVLAAAAEHGIEVSSDGDAADWVDGVEFASKTLGRKVPMPEKISGQKDLTVI